ncbi:MAG: prolipoprotein diacylglyceryl transferase [Anaeroplasma sp.]
MFDFWINESFNIGGITITWYAIFIMIGVVIAVWCGIKEGKKLGIPSDTVYLGVVITLPIAIIGARLWYVLFNLNSFNNFFEVLGFVNGKFIGLAGLAIQGGVIAALITVYIYCRKRKVSLYRVLDIVAPGFLIGQICGRWGNFCNHELYGPIVENYKFLASIPILGDNMYIAGAYRHPVFLYESFLNLIGLTIILVLRRKYKKLQSGDLMGVYLAWYGLVRIFTESLRLNSGVSEPIMIGNVSVSILTSIIFIIMGVFFLVAKRFVGPKQYYQDVLAEIEANKFDTILFDLDGTLLNTKPLIDRSFIHTFEHFRPDYILTDEELDSFFGPTLYQTFSRYSNDEEEIQAMIQYYRDYNIPHHDEMVKPFPGAKDTLRLLHKKGYKLGVVSSKKTDLVRHGLEIFGLLEYMDIVVGADEVTNHKPAPDGINLAVEKLEGKNVAYVGDTLNDMQAAHAANVKAIGALYIKHPEIMLDANPDYVINKLSDLISICVE